MKHQYEFLPDLILRAPYYGYHDYDPERLPEIINDPAFRKALWLASPSLYSQLENRKFEFGQFREKEKFTLLKYYNRMCYRATPFGSFASISAGRWAEGQPARIGPENNDLLHLFPDLRFLDNAQRANPPEKTLQQLILNPSFYKMGNEYRFIKSLPGANDHLEFQLEALPTEPLYVELVNYCKPRSVIYPELSVWLISKTGCSQQEANDHLDFLIETQVFYNGRMTGLIGAEIERLSAISGKFNHHYIKRTVYSDFSVPVLSESGANENESFWYSALERKWGSGGPGIEEQDELMTALRLLGRFSLSKTPASLSQFKERFREKFGGQKVALLEAIDPDSGIMYYPQQLIGQTDAEPLGVQFPVQINPLTAEWTEEHRLLFNRWKSAVNGDACQQIELHSTDIKHQPGDPSPTITLMFRKTEEFLIIDHAGGASATSLSGRFSLFGEAFFKIAKKAADLESAANPEVIFADIDHRSDLHSDNINRREKLYSHSISVNTADFGADVLPVKDLDIFLLQDQLVLESRSLQKRIVPRLSTAYNYHRSGLGLFSLLCDLQYEGLSVVEQFDLAQYFPGLAFYPRVVIDQTILSCAKWQLTSNDLKDLVDATKGSVILRARKFRKRYQLPLTISVGDFDQQLVFNLSNEPEINLFTDLVKGKDKVTIQEYLHPGKSVKCGNRPFAGQFISLLHHGRTIYKGIEKTNEYTVAGKVREYLLGDEWLYLKIFCTPEVANLIIGKVLPRFIAEHENKLDCWFFIRYRENGEQLRLRFRSKPALIGTLLVSFLAIIRAEGLDRLIHSYNGDTYQRELERYPPDHIELVENVFREGSEFICEKLRLNPDTSSSEEFLNGLATAYDLLLLFLKPNEIVSFCEAGCEGFFIEFGNKKSLVTDMDKAFRLMRTDIDKVLDHIKPDGRYHHARSLAGVITIMPEKQRKMLVADIVHMQMNRNFRTRQRQQEYLVYHCLYKFWRSRIAQKKLS